jgi:hypothetical protein
VCVCVCARARARARACMCRLEREGDQMLSKCFDGSLSVGRVEIFGDFLSVQMENELFVDRRNMKESNKERGKIH